MEADNGNQTPAEQAEERKMWTDRYFNLAESVIKEWIAEYIEESPNVVFDDYNERSDVLGTEEKGEHYTVYLDIYNNDELIKNEDGSTNTFILTQDTLKTLPKVARAVSVVFDSVYAVYMPIVHTMINFADKIRDVFPKFDESTMSFGFVMINRLEQEKQKHRDLVYRILAEEDKVAKLEGDQADDIRKKLVELKTKAMNDHNNITLDDVAAQQTVCDITNAVLKDAPRLCIVLEKGKHVNEEHIMQRLPEFGFKYQDPDEETLVDKMKRENNID